jgi:hypothetical protein
VRRIYLLYHIIAEKARHTAHIIAGRRREKAESEERGVRSCGAALPQFKKTGMYAPRARLK